MSKQAPKREPFIQQYRRKLQTDLDNMGYPGGSSAGQPSEPLIIDASRELSRQTGETLSRKGRQTVRS